MRNPTRFTVIAAMLTAAASLSCSVAFAQATNAHPGAARAAGGIWKAAVPVKPMKGEFDSYDPLGVAAGARIKADCSLNWIDPDDGKLFCFSSGTSLVYFLDRPQANIARARRGWEKLSAKPN